MKSIIFFQLMLDLLAFAVLFSVCYDQVSFFNVYSFYQSICVMLQTRWCAWVIDRYIIFLGLKVFPLAPVTCSIYRWFDSVTTTKFPSGSVTFRQVLSVTITKVPVQNIADFVLSHEIFYLQLRISPTIFSYRHRTVDDDTFPPPKVVLKLELEKMHSHLAQTQLESVLDDGASNFENPLSILEIHRQSSRYKHW